MLQRLLTLLSSEERLRVYDPDQTSKPNPLQSASSPAVIKAVANLRRSLAARTPGQCRNLDEGTLETSSLGRSQPGFTGKLMFERAHPERKHPLNIGHAPVPV